MERHINLLQALKREFKEAATQGKMMFFGFITCILVIRAQSLYTRVKRYRDYKMKKLIEKEMLTKYVPKKSDAVGLNSLTWDVYGNMSSYLAIDDMARLALVNPKYKRLNDVDSYWEAQFNANWKSRYTDTQADKSYKDKCITAFKQDKASKAKKALSQEERDILFGLYYIFYEEFLLSLMDSPHILLIPIKLLTFAISKISTFTLAHFFRWQSKKFVTQMAVIFSERNFTDTELLRFQNLLNEPKTFRNLHLPFVYIVFYNVFRYIHEVGYRVTLVYYYLMKWTSAGTSRAITVEWQENNFQRLRLNYQGEPAEIQNSAKRSLFYMLQIIVGLFMLVSWILFALAPIPFCLYVLNKGWVASIVGPLFLNLGHYATAFNIAWTVGVLQHESIHYFKPLHAIYYTGRFIGTTTWRSMTFVVTTIYKPIKYIAQGIYKGLATVLKLIFDAISGAAKGIIKIVGGIIRLFRGAVTGVFGLYLGILTSATKMSLKLGIVGDLLLTIFALVWMFWPLVLVYYKAPSKLYFIPSGVFSIIFLLTGYKGIKTVTGK
jgi:hypothetical protein